MLFFVPLVAVTTLLQAFIPGAPTPETFVPMDAAARGTDVSLWILRQFPSTATALTELELALQLGSSNALVYSAPLGLYAWRSFSTVRTLATYADRLLSPSSAELESRRRSARCGCAPGLAVLPSGTSTGWCISVLTLPAPVPLLSLPAPSPILTLPAPRPVLTLPAPAPILALPAPKPVLSMIVAPVPTFLSTPVRGLYPVATKPVVHSTTRKWHDHLSMACLVVLTLGFQLVANRLFEGFPQVANYLLDDVTETPGECDGLEHALDPSENLATDTSDVEPSRRLSGLAHDLFRFCDPSKLPDAALEDTLEAPSGSRETVEGMAGGDTREKSPVPEDSSVETEESQGPRKVDGAAASSEVPVNNGRLLDSVPGPDSAHDQSADGQLELKIEDKPETLCEEVGVEMQSEAHPVDVATSRPDDLSENLGDPHRQTNLVWPDEVETSLANCGTPDEGLEQRAQARGSDTLSQWAPQDGGSWGEGYRGGQGSGGRGAWGAGVQNGGWNRGGWNGGRGGGYGGARGAYSGGGRGGYGSGRGGYSGERGRHGNGNGGNGGARGGGGYRGGGDADRDGSNGTRRESKASYFFRLRHEKKDAARAAAEN